MDLLGFFGAILCAIHCVAVPILLSIFAVGILTQDWLEYAFIIFTCSIAGYALGMGYLRQHQNLLPLGLFFLGLVCISTVRIVESSVVEVMGTVAGASIIASAHLMNWKLLKSLKTRKAEAL